MTGVTLLVAVAGTLLADQPSQKVTVSVNAVPGLNGVVDLEIRNISDEFVESTATVLLTLRPLDRSIYPLFDGILSAQVSPKSGLNEDHESRRTAGPFRLAPGGGKVARVRLANLLWSLGPNWVWQPRRFWELASSGEYELFVQLVFDDLRLGRGPNPVTVRLSILEARSSTPVLCGLLPSAEGGSGCEQALLASSS
jgi:hypothetical protein